MLLGEAKDLSGEGFPPLLSPLQAGPRHRPRGARCPDTKPARGAPRAAGERGDGSAWSLLAGGGSSSCGRRPGVASAWGCVLPAGRLITRQPDSCEITAAGKPTRRAQPAEAAAAERAPAASCLDFPVRRTMGRAHAGHGACHEPVLRRLSRCRPSLWRRRCPSPWLSRRPAAQSPGAEIHRARRPRFAPLGSPLSE